MWSWAGNFRCYDSKQFVLIWSENDIPDLPNVGLPQENHIRLFAQRLWDLAAQIRLDAEQLMSLAVHLLPVLAGKMNKNTMIFSKQTCWSNTIKETSMMCLKRAT